MSRNRTKRKIAALALLGAALGGAVFAAGSALARDDDGTPITDAAPEKAGEADPARAGEGWVTGIEARDEESRYGEKARGKGRLDKSFRVILSEDEEEDEDEDEDE